MIPETIREEVDINVSLRSNLFVVSYSSTFDKLWVSIFIVLAFYFIENKFLL